MIEIINSISKYNYWNGNSFDSGYERVFYTDKIGQYNKLVKVLVGQRRAGKSYILRQIASELILRVLRARIYSILTKSIWN